MSVESCDSKCYGCADVVQMGSDEDTSKRSCNLISISHEKCFDMIQIYFTRFNKFNVYEKV